MEINQKSQHNRLTQCRLWFNENVSLMHFHCVIMCVYFVDEVDFSFQGYLKIVSLASETLNYSHFFSPFLSMIPSNDTITRPNYNISLYWIIWRRKISLCVFRSTQTFLINIEWFRSIPTERILPKFNVFICPYARFIIFFILSHVVI